MIRLRNLTYGLLAFGAAAALYRKYTDTQHAAPARFIDEAMLQSLGEIEAARLALERTNNEQVRIFARQMIDDHTALNGELERLASHGGYQITGATGLTAKARESLTNLKSSHSFDRAYAEHQITSHRQAIELYRRGTRLDDFDVGNFSRTTLDKMQHHLVMAEQLAEAVNSGLAPATPADAAATAEVDANEAGLSSGSPQQNRGNATNPHH